MAIAFIAASERTFVQSGNSFTLTKPATFGTTDTVIVAIAYEVAGPPNFAFSAGTVVELLEDFDNANNNTGLAVFKITGDSTGGSWTITSALSSSDWVAAVAAAYSGVNHAGIIVGTAYSTDPGGSDFNIPAITFAGTNNVAVVCLNQQFTSTPRTYSPSFTNRENNDSIQIADASFASSGSTGTVAVTNSGFSSAIAILIGLEEAVTAITGTMAVTEAPDTVSFTGTETISGTIAVTDANDTSAISGTETITGSIAVTDAADVAALAGATADVVGSMAVTEANDVAALAGTETITGTIAVTEANDTPAIAGTEIFTGTIAVTEQNDTSAIDAAAAEASVGTIAVTMADHVAAIAASYDPSSILITGTIAVIEQDDQWSLTGYRMGKAPVEVRTPGPVFRSSRSRRRYYDNNANPVIGD